MFKISKGNLYKQLYIINCKNTILHKKYFVCAQYNYKMCPIFEPNLKTLHMSKSLTRNPLLCVVQHAFDHFI